LDLGWKFSMAGFTRGLVCEVQTAFRLRCTNKTRTDGFLSVQRFGGASGNFSRASLAAS
jgi:hypothetical protein